MTARPATARTRRRASPRGRGRGGFALLLALVGAGIVSGDAGLPTPGQERPSRRTEAEVRAGFLLGFPAYVGWPEKALADGAPLIIGLVDSPDVAREVRERLVALRRKEEAASGGRKEKPRRPVEVREIDSESTTAIESVTGCHILYISGRIPAERAAGLLGGVAGGAVLTVEDRGRDGPPRAVIELYVEDQRLRFAVRLEALRARGLAADSRMLRLGTIIDETTERGAPPRSGPPRPGERAEPAPGPGRAEGKGGR